MLTRILLLIFALIILPTLYIYGVYVRPATRNRWLRALAFAPAALLLIYFLATWSNDDMRPEHQAPVGNFLVTLFAITVPALLFTLIDGIGWLVHRFWPNDLARRIIRIVAMTIAFAAFLIAIYGHRVGHHRYIVERQTLEFSDLPPAFDGFRIALFTDLHIGTFARKHRADVDTIVSIINNLHPDIILFGGDIVNFQNDELDGYEPILRKLQAPCGVVSIMGNHDYAMYIKDSTFDAGADIARLQQRQRGMDWQLLLNDHITLERDSQRIVIAGVENDGEPPFPQLGDLKKTLQGVPDTAFVVLLSHDPTHWRRNILPETRVQLTLSGHTHAGQFKLFGWSPVQYRYSEWSGLYREGERTLLVSEGSGQVLFPFRFGAWPQINLITLKTKQ